MGRFGQAPIGSLPTRSNRIWVSAARPRPTDQRKDTRSLIRRGQTCSDSNTIMLTVIGIALPADRRRDAGGHEAIGVPHREILDTAALVGWSSELGIGMTLFDRWESIVDQALFWAGDAKPVAARRAVRRIHERLIVVEASPRTVALWAQLTGQQDAEPGQ